MRAVVFDRAAPDASATHLADRRGARASRRSWGAAGYDAVLVRDHGVAQALREETGGRGADVILDPQGNAHGRPATGARRGSAA